MLSIRVTPKQLRLARNALRLNQSDVASKVDMSLKAYSSIERGEVDPKLSNYIRIIEFFEKNKITFHDDDNVTLNSINSNI